MENALYEEILNALEDMYLPDLIHIYNNYCIATDNYDDKIYLMNEFDERMESFTPWEVARLCFDGDFRPCDNYFYFNGYGNIMSFDFIDQANINIERIAEYIKRNNDALHDDTIQTILDEEEE